MTSRNPWSPQLSNSVWSRLKTAVTVRRTKEKPCKKLEWDHSLSRQMKQIDRVNNLVLWHLHSTMAFSASQHIFKRSEACWNELPAAHTHTQPFNGPLSGTTRVSRYQKGKINLDFTEARDSEWQWHQLGHLLVCISLQTDNRQHLTTQVIYRPDALRATQPTASKHWRLAALK